MGYVTGGGTSGSGAVSSVAGRTGVVTLAVADVSGAAPLADPTFTGTVTLPNSTVTSAMLAGSIAPSKVTGTAVTAADTGTVTSTMLVDGTILNADVNASAAVAYSKLNLSASVKNSDLVAGTVQDANLATAYARNGSTVYRETMPWWSASSGTVALSTGVMSLTGVHLVAGDSITNVTFHSGGTALSTATHWWFALYGADLNLIGQTADQTSTAWGATTTKTIALASGPFTIAGASAGYGYVGLMVAAAATPTIRGVNTGTQVATGVANQKIGGATNGLGLTTTAPPGAIVLTAAGNGYYAVLT